MILEGPLNMMLAVVLSYIAFIKLHSLYIHFVESFYHVCMENFVKWFSGIYWNEIIFILHIVNVL